MPNDEDEYEEGEVITSDINGNIYRYHNKKNKKSLMEEIDDGQND